MNPAIDVQNLVKRYGTTTALSGISFTVQPGEIMGFLGPNGAGKTTTLRILTGILSPTEGQVRIDGLDVADHAIEVRRRIGYLPEHVALYPEMRVEEYLNYRSRIKGVKSNQRTSRIANALERCALVEVRRKLIGRLSKGYRQRVALADCLLAEPKILILDEPTIGLDPHQIRQTRELIMQLGKTTTILLSTHILPEVEMACQRVAIINRGTIVAVDTPQALRQQLEGRAIVRVELAANAEGAENALRQLPGVSRVSVQGRSNGSDFFDIEATGESDIREAIFHLAVKNKGTLRELSHSRASLEDVFIHLTTHEN